MRCQMLLCSSVSAILLAATTAVAGPPPVPLHVLYIGGAKTDRAVAFDQFLHKHFARVTLADRESFDPAMAKQADLVLFDWDQADSPMAKTTVSFGRLEDWTKPTVLLNHSGLLLAGQWQLIGGAG